MAPYEVTYIINDLKVAHLQVFFVYLIPGRIGIWKCWFLRRGGTGVPGEKPLRENERTTNKLVLHAASTLGFEPGPQ